MSGLQRMSDRMLRRVVDLRGQGERGDVPGWVLITLMTAGLVTAIWQFFRRRRTA